MRVENRFPPRADRKPRAWEPLPPCAPLRRGRQGRGGASRTGLLPDGQEDRFASGVGLDETFYQAGEDRGGLDQDAGDEALAHDDAAVDAVVDAVAGLDHRTTMGQGGIERHERQRGARRTGGLIGRLTGQNGGRLTGLIGGRLAQRMGMVQGYDERHFALILMAAMDEHGVGASGQAGGRVFAAGADVEAAYLQDAVGSVGADDGAKKGDGQGSGRGALRRGNGFLHKIKNNF